MLLRFYILDEKNALYKPLPYKTLIKKWAKIGAFIGVITAIVICLSPLDLESLWLKKQYQHLETVLQKQYHQLLQQSHQLTLLYEKDKRLYAPLLDLSPLTEARWIGGIGGTQFYPNFTNPLAVEALVRLDRVSKQIHLLKQRFSEVEQQSQLQLHLLQHTMPLGIPVWGRLTSGFGIRKDPFSGRWRPHYGVDINARYGTKVKATGEGVVVFAGNKGNGYGLYIDINHGNGFVTRYAHLSKIYVRPGQKVKRGQVIGAVGSSGYSTGAHLHYEIIKNGKKINPIFYLGIGL